MVGVRPREDDFWGVAGRAPDLSALLKGPAQRPGTGPPERGSHPPEDGGTQAPTARGQAASRATGEGWAPPESSAVHRRGYFTNRGSVDRRSPLVPNPAGPSVTAQGGLYGRDGCERPWCPEEAGKPPGEVTADRPKDKRPVGQWEGDDAVDRRIECH